LEPLERYRRSVIKWFARRRPFEKRRYVEQEGLDFDDRLLGLRPQRTIYLDGLWQSEGYFKDVKQAIREDLSIIPPMDTLNQSLAEKIRNSQSVALHMRWFDAPGGITTHNAPLDYYQRAIALLEQQVDSPWYFVFSDYPDAAQAALPLPASRVTIIRHNRQDAEAYVDLWLMTQCRNFIISNSTFSWWGAWLANERHKIVLAPTLKIFGKAAWGFKGLIPNDWMTI
jgi:hypothetical protein